MKVTFSVLFTFLFLFAVSSVSAQTKPAAVLPVAAHYEGGQEALYEFIKKEMVYPPLAKRNRIAGQCIISFKLNEDGSTTNHKIIKNVGANTGEEALRIVKLIKFKAPGYSMDTSIPVNFKL